VHLHAAGLLGGFPYIYHARDDLVKRPARRCGCCTRGKTCGSPDMMYLSTPQDDEVRAEQEVMDETNGMRHAHHRDLAEKLAAVYARLVRIYGVPEWRPDHDVLGGLIGTILSQNTSDVNSERAYRQLRAAFPTWEAVRDAPTQAVADAIRSGGLAQLKAERIQQVLRMLTECQSGVPLSLDVLERLDMDEARAYLRALPGVGPKTAAVVLLFSAGMPAFPVDTHVWRVTRRLGLIGPRVSAEAAHEQLEQLIPVEWRHTMHVDLIRHGRQICHAQRPACHQCALRGECDYYWAAIVQHE
jgi:endonuclease III